MNKHDRRISLGHDRHDPDKGSLEASVRENRWCERHSYFIDLTACESRAKTRPSCARCIARWRQLCFPFMDL
ncbi:MAG: hypothetical protein C0394_07585 [Syntrophus sp. (in: bacteria)]|nr:hypothetical protein [Syntrophus sp. (in: bacteria)]